MNELKDLLMKNFPAINFEDEHLVQDGTVDSVTIVEIITLLEDTYDIEITMEYIQPKYFESVQAMLEMIEELQ